MAVAATPGASQNPAPKLDAESLQLLDVIAATNSANRAVLNSFDAEYKSVIASPEVKGSKGADGRIVKNGRVAFSGAGKRYGYESFENDPAQHLHFIQNGSKFLRRTQDSPGLVETGSKPELIKPGTPEPWEMIDAGISRRINQLDADKDGAPVSVKRSTLGGKDVVEVVIRRPVPPGGGDFTVTLSYSISEGYTPIQFHAVVRGADGTLREGWGDVSEVKKYPIGGGTVFVPVAYHERWQFGGNQQFDLSYNVKADSVRLNPQLPDSLFEMPIAPDDQIVNQDLGMELRGPGGRDFVSQSVDTIQPAANRAAVAAGDPNGIPLCAGAKIDLVRIPEGSFLLGTPPDEIGYPSAVIEQLRRRQGGSSRPANEVAPHKVTIKKGFRLGATEITCAQFRCFRPGYKLPRYMGETLDGDRKPAIVTRAEAVEFCKWLSTMTGLTVRLPREDEWEYACRAGTQSRFYWGDSEQDAGSYANVADKTFEGTSPGSVHCFATDDGHAGTAEVGTYRPNGFGLYDMIGNVPEWCADEYRDLDGVATAAPSTRPRYIYRGGGFQSDVSSARSGARAGAEGNDPNLFIGFRVLVEGDVMPSGHPMPVTNTAAASTAIHPPYGRWLALLAVLGGGILLMRAYLRSRQHP